MEYFVKNPEIYAMYFLKKLLDFFTFGCYIPCQYYIVL